MKSLLFIIIAGLSCLTASAQSSRDELYALTTSSVIIGLGSVRVVDPYLTPFEYGGTQVRLQSDKRRYLGSADKRLSYSNKGFIDFGNTYHPTRTNSMLIFNTNYMFGLNYHFRPAEKLMVLVGGGWDIGLGGRYLGRNVNNPFSLDLYTNINATAEAQYVFRLWKKDFKVQYGTRVPVLGYMFVPEQGATYYELFMLGNMNNAFHFSSLHNRQGWAHYINLHIPTKYTTFRITAQHDVLHYSANDIVFRKSGLTFNVGTTVDMYVFSGDKRKIPVNFVSSYE